MPQKRRLRAGIRGVPARAPGSIISLLYDARSAYDLKVVAGVAEYLQTRPHLAVSLEGDPRSPAARVRLASAAAGGVIADLNNAAIARRVKHLRVPVVGFGSPQDVDSPIPHLRANNVHIADLAADHLLSGALRHFAFCGFRPAPATRWSIERERAFLARVSAAGFAGRVCHLTARDVDGRAVPVPSLVAWVRTLPKPAGIMAANDLLGRQVLAACRAAAVSVPDEVSVVGVDNDEVLCQFCHPPLSSIEQGARRLGAAAARLLVAMLEGHDAPREPSIVNPMAVVVRGSSNPAAVSHRDVAHAIGVIAARIGDRIDVAAVARAVAVPRWRLEQLFRNVLGRSVAAEIRRCRLVRVRDLVAGADLPLKQIASLSGFSSVQHMTTAFLEAFGTTPAQYRRGVSWSGRPAASRRVRNL